MKKKAQDPLVARPTSRPTFALLMGYRRRLLDTCKSSSVLVVSTFVAFIFSLFLLSTDYVYNDELSLLHIMTSYDS